MLVLITSITSLATSPPLRAQQMQGEAATAFLAEAGILPQIVADVPPQGRPFLEPTPYNATDYTAGDEFGYSIAVSGDILIVGVPYAVINGSSYQGAAYVFVRSGTNWSQQQKLVAADGAAYDYFGQSVALDGETALIGAQNAAIGGNSYQGAAYVFVRSGTNWSQQQKLVAADGATDDYFGTSVALDGETALVGADYAAVGGNSYQGKEPHPQRKSRNGILATAIFTKKRYRNDADTAVDYGWVKVWKRPLVGTLAMVRFISFSVCFQNTSCGCL